MSKTTVRDPALAAVATEPLLTPEELGEVLKKPYGWVIDPKQTPIPRTRIGKNALRFTQENVRRYIAAQTEKVPAQRSSQPDELIPARRSRAGGRK